VKKLEKQSIIESQTDANAVYSNIKSLFASVKREYYKDPEFGRQIGNIDTILDPLIIGDKEIDVRVRFCFALKFSEFYGKSVLLSDYKPTQHFFVSIRDTDNGMPKGDSDLYDWISCNSVDNVSIAQMIEFAKVLVSAFEKKKDVISKLIQDGKKPKIVIQKFIEKILIDMSLQKKDENNGKMDKQGKGT
jgi:hypothetical protein